MQGRSVHHACGLPASVKYFVNLVYSPFPDASTHGAESLMNSGLRARFPSLFEFVCSRLVKVSSDKKVHSSQICSRRAGNLQ
jgi:hypothetical protein